MSACNTETIKLIGKYLNTPVGPVCYNTDRVLTTVLGKQNVYGFASIVLQLVSKSGVQMSQENLLLSYQWLEHIAIYSNQAVTNPILAKNFLQDINKALQRNTYLTGNFINIVDVATYYALYPLLERLPIYERESLLHLFRWSKHIQAQPKVCSSKPPLALNNLTLSVLAPIAH
ncbi:eukaryotic translation elongation factor 1 epsilon-1 [Achroia grisella]|uniref:eukaryotic translation elongation factor 1 epsilon-1 n=1 Tax=Achroia grisella TaxID=688607 RepID=UPI0027D322D7|nr:eukaryotic translation elongation factor 1 epsilon-1 [Achroia grisella]